MKKIHIIFILILAILLSIFLPSYKEYFIPNRHDQNISIYKNSPLTLKTFKQNDDKDNLNSMCIPCDTECKPECCDPLERNNYPIYSCSTGCVCLNDRQYNYLLHRGGNNIDNPLNEERKQQFPIPTKIDTQFALSN